MRPIRLELYNFLAYHNPEPINFEGLNVACLSGPNGAGKSALLDAITWVLWKRARARVDDELIHLGGSTQDEMYVMLDFMQDGSRYRVTRKHSRRGRGTSSLDLFSWDIEGESWRPMSESLSTRETQDQIVKLLRLDYETFVNSAFLQQGRADSFTLKTAGQRKAILAEILGLSRWDDYEQRAKDRLTEIEQQVSLNRTRIEEIEGEERQKPILQQRLTETSTRLTTAEKALADAETFLAEVADAPVRMRAAADKIDTLDRHLSQLEKDGKSTERELNEHRVRLSGYERILERRDEIEQGYTALLEAREIDQAQNERLSQQSEISEQLADLRGQLNTMRARLETQVKALARRVEEADRDIRDVEAAADEMEKLRPELDSLQTRKGERDQVLAEQKTLAEEKATLTARNASLMKEMKEIRAALDRMADSGEAFCPMCRRPLDDEHLAHLENEGKGRSDAYRANERALKETNQTITRYETLLKDIDRDLKGYDKLRAREGALADRIGKADAAIKRMHESRRDLDETVRALDNEEFGAELRESITALEVRAAEVGYDRATHNAAKERIKALRSAEDEKRKLDSAAEARPGTERAIELCEARIKTLTEQIATERQARAEVDSQLVELRALVAEEVQRRKERDKRRQELFAIRDEKIALEQQLRAIENETRRKTELMVRLEQLEEERLLYSELRVALGKNGVPAMIIEAAIPELEETANDLLARMTDGRMHIRLDTQRAKKTGGVIETLDILISDELGTRDYDMYSGGEGFRVNFALRIALSQLLARRAGARLPTPVIDEGFGSQDQIGRERLVEAINAVRKDFDLIMIVTHIEELRDMFPAHIEVRKTASGSVVKIR